MRYNGSRLFFAAAALVAVLGAGCAAPSKDGDATDKSKSLSRLTPKEAALAINFKQGSSFEIQQSALKVQGEYVQGDPALSRRLVTLNDFKPGVGAALQWTLQQKVETEEYKKALADFQTGATSTRPKPSYGLYVTAGSLTAINLSQAHKLMLPGLWPDGEERALSTSGVWVSRFVFEELSRTRVSTVYSDILDGASPAGRQAAGIAAGRGDVKKALELVRNQVDKISSRVEVDLMKAEGDLAEKTLEVNGKPLTVQVIRARNWYGEMTVLNNPANPLILSFYLNPPLTGDAAEASGGMNFLKGLMSYEVTKIDL